MQVRVSKSKIETQGRDERITNDEQKNATDCSESGIYSQIYKEILARELLINDSQEEYCKYF